MGSPKQLLRLGGESLVRRAATTALASHCSPVIVVVGAEAESVTREIEDLPVERVENVHWAEGMGSSIRAGVIAAAATHPPPDAVLVTLADQLAVTAPSSTSSSQPPRRHLRTSSLASTPARSAPLRSLPAATSTPSAV